MLSLSASEADATARRELTKGQATTLTTVGFPASHKHEEKDHEDHAYAARRGHADWR
jgi:hypothetical protein